MYEAALERSELEHHFNPTLVQLEYFNCSYNNLYSLIFQSHIGAIRIAHVLACQHARAHFNPTLVQLEST